MTLLCPFQARYENQVIADRLPVIEQPNCHEEQCALWVCDPHGRCSFLALDKPAPLAMDINYLTNAVRDLIGVLRTMR